MEDAVTATPLSAMHPSRGGPVSVRVQVDDLSRVGEARRAADDVARSVGLDAATRGVLGVVTTEAATNLARHATHGWIYLRDTSASGRIGVEVIAVDSGPGMQNVARAVTDGYSTGGTPGTGLGAMRRMSDHFDIYSQPASGTVLLARIFENATEGTSAGNLVDVGVICRPIETERTCGDGWAIVQSAERAIVLVVDGLGHGPSAAEAADAAIDAFPAVAAQSPKEILAAVHGALRSTRGGAVGIAEIMKSDDGAKVTFSGAGNISASVTTAAGSRALPSMNGTAGLRLRGVQEFFAELPPDGQLIIHSDGVTARWRLASYPGLLRHDPALSAAVLHRDFTRGNDDATVVAIRLRSLLT